MCLAVKGCWGKDKDHFSSHGKFLSKKKKKKKSQHRAQTMEDKGNYNIIVTGAGFFFSPLLELKGRKTTTELEEEEILVLADQDYHAGSPLS